MTYVLVALGSISTLFATVMLLVWRLIDRKPHVLAWAGAYGAAAAQWACVLRGGFVEGDPVEFRFLGNACAIVSLSLVLAGYRMRARLPLRVALLTGSGFVVLAAVLWFSAIDPHAGLGAGLVPLYSGLLLGVAVAALLRAEGPTLAAEWASAALVGVLVSIQLGAGGLALAGGGEGAGDWLERSVMLQVLTLPAAYAGLGIFMIFLVATDLSEQTKRLAIVDPLTAVMNRRGFLDAAVGAIGRARRAASPLTLVMTDLDHFKRINDTYGHATGDRALLRFATHLSSELRQGDLVGRIGGEEFAMLLADTELENGVLVAERLCHALSIAAIEVSGARIQLTASFGVALLADADGDVEDLLDRADRGLYRAKETGRNRVCVAPDEEDPPGPDFAVA
jgi:diguanylate cyclase (GGDEF)-like protein